MQVIQRTKHTSSTADALSYTPTLPNAALAAVGDAIWCFVAIDGNGVPSTTSSGWTRYLYGSESGGQVTGAVFHFPVTVAATIGALVVNNTNTQQYSSAFVHVRADAGKRLVPAYPSGGAGGGAGQGSSTNSNPPVITAGTDDKIAQGTEPAPFAIAFRAGDAAVVATVAPTGYANLQSQAGGTNGASINTAEYQTVASDWTATNSGTPDFILGATYDPPAFTSATEQWVAGSVVIEEEPLPVVALTATNISAPTPAISTATIAQKHTLSPTNIAAPTPSIGLATMGVVSNLSALAIAAPTPAISQATLTQVHNLSAQNIAAPTPAISLASAAIISNLSAVGIAAPTPAIALATLTQSHVLAALNISAPTPAISLISMAGIHSLTAQSIASPTPVISVATVVVTSNLSTQNIAAPTPVIATATLTQKQVLSALNISAPTPAIATATIGQIHSLSASNIAAPTPVIALSTMGQIYALTASNISAPSPAIQLPTMGVIGSIITQARPVSTVSTGGWRTDSGGVDLHNAIDEASPNDADYIISGNNVANDTTRIKVSGWNAANVYGPIKMSLRTMRDGSDAAFTQTVRVYQGNTLIAGPFVYNATALTTFEQDIDSSLVTDPNDLYVELEAA